MENPPKAPDATLDVTGDACPMTFVKTKLQLEGMQAGQVLAVLLREGEPLDSVAQSCEEEGHRVLRREELGGWTWKLWIRCGGAE